jgi:hypothetical protein
MKRQVHTSHSFIPSFGDVRHPREMTRLIVSTPESCPNMSSSSKDLISDDGLSRASESIIVAFPLDAGLTWTLEEHDDDGYG